MIDFKKKAEEIEESLVKNLLAYQINKDLIEKALKEVWNEAIEKCASETGMKSLLDWKEGSRA